MSEAHKKQAEEEVSRIATAVHEGWSPERYELYVTRLANIFESYEKGLMKK